jgi:hypothetical protein
MLVEPFSWYLLGSRIPLRWEELRMESAVERGPDWAGPPVIATVVRLLSPYATARSSDPKPRG